jgi:hypothetical protein
VPEDLDARTVVAVLLGPMISCALFGEPQRIGEVGAFAVERFLASYSRPTRARRSLWGIGRRSARRTRTW